MKVVKADRHPFVLTAHSMVTTAGSHRGVKHSHEPSNRLASWSDIFQYLTPLDMCCLLPERAMEKVREPWMYRALMVACSLMMTACSSPPAFRDPYRTAPFVRSTVEPCDDSPSLNGYEVEKKE